MRQMSYILRLTEGSVLQCWKASFMSSIRLIVTLVNLIELQTVPYKLSDSCAKYLYTHTHPFNGPLSATTRVSRYQKGTRSSAIADGPRDASCQLKSCQLPRNSAETTYTTSPDQIDGMKLEI